MNFQNLPDVEIKAITDDFDVDALLSAILVENREGGIDVGMLLNKMENG